MHCGYAYRLMSEVEKLDMTQQQFANQIGVSLSSAKRYISGEREIKISHLKALYEIGVDVFYLVTGDRFPASSQENKFFRQGEMCILCVGSVVDDAVCIGIYRRTGSIFPRRIGAISVPLYSAVEVGHALLGVAGKSEGDSHGT